MISVRGAMAPVRFVVLAQAEPQTLARVVNYVAQLGKTPRRVRADEHGGLMTIVIEQDGLSDHQAKVMAEKMRASVLVERVTLTLGRKLIDPTSGQLSVEKGGSAGTPASHPRGPR
ncbi:hypothetical protein Sphch_1847 [Sphingobium chlorophenolicum L-1]|uniref:ACT domain-containing protein n=1 Tax=Sphingobium chlorophenolicum L-1 TaxID=690566 RepID=F6ETN6_SPHCR|nr:hypothetical protein [Sphingobium chlorophenolicum]AEG49531.1 hypothetical protein Sphch_1847 [Sphingobium chlorophenolicum L-1]